MVSTVSGDEARRHIDVLAKKYTSGDYAGKIQSERVILQIEPARERVWG